MSNKNITLEEPESLWQWLVRVWSIYPFQLIGINCLFLICCLPIFTIPAAYCGLNAVVQRYYRKLYASNMIKVFWSEFKEKFWKRSGIVWGITISVIIAIKYLEKVQSAVLGYSIVAIMLLITLIIFSWFFSQAVFLNLSPMQILKNAVIFLVIETYRNFALIVLWVICLTVLLFGWPISGFLLFVMPVVQTTLLTGITMPVLQKYLVK